MAAGKTTGKKKRWFKIIAPKSFRSAEIGEMPSLEPETLIGKNASVSATTVLNDPRKQNLKLIFKIKDIKTDQANTELLGYEIVRSQLKRLSRKGNEKIDDSFVAVSKDGQKIRLKPVLTTKGKTNNSVVTAIRKSTRQILSDKLKSQTYDDFVLEVLTSKTQKMLKEQLKKLHPVAHCEFRMIRRE